MTDRDIIEDFLIKIKNKLLERIPTVTGTTADSLEVKTNPQGGQLLGAAHIGAVEYGRGPRKSTASSGMAEKIQVWLQAKGMDSEWDNAVGLTMHINKHGTALFREGAPSGVLSDVINNDAFNSLTKSLAQSNMLSLTSEVLKGFKLAKIS